MRAKLLILLCFFCHSVFAEVDTDVVERYQQLSRWLETENADLEPIIRFYNQQQGKGVILKRSLQGSIYKRV